MSNHRQRFLFRAVPAAFTAAFLALVPTVSTAGECDHGWHHGYGDHNQAGRYFLEPTPYHFKGHFDPECEDVAVKVKYNYKGIDSTRHVRGTHGQAFFYKDSYRFTEVWKDTDSGDVLFTWHGKAKYQEVKATRVRKADVPADQVPPEGLTGPVYRFINIEKAHTVLKNADGDALYLTDGVVIDEQLFDTLGDKQPGGEELDSRHLKVYGPHPLLDVDVCDVAADLAA